MVLVAVDSFKGSISSISAGLAIKEGLRKKNIKCKVFPVADGGEGTLEVFYHALKPRRIFLNVKDPVMSKIRADALIKNDEGFVELARASGLALLKKEERNPLKTTTYGTGQIISFLIKKDVKKIYLATGGSATCDCGAGILYALGFRFSGVDGVPAGGDLIKIGDIKFPENYSELKKIKFVILVDVENKLLGRLGAARVFAPQKGADEAAVKILEKGLKKFSGIIEKKTGKDVSKIKGSGAAGGVPAGMMLLNSSIVSGAVEVIRILNIENWIKKSSYVITGEGRIDFQTGFGKIPYVIGKIAKKYGKKVIGVCGAFHGYDRRIFDAVFSIADGPRSEDYMMKNAGVLLKNIAESIGGLILK